MVHYSKDHVIFWTYQNCSTHPHNTDDYSPKLSLCKYFVKLVHQMVNPTISSDISTISGIWSKIFDILSFSIWPSPSSYTSKCKSQTLRKSFHSLLFSIGYHVIAFLRLASLYIITAQSRTLYGPWSFFSCNENLSRWQNGFFPFTQSSWNNMHFVNGIQMLYMLRFMLCYLWGHTYQFLIHTNRSYNVGSLSCTIKYSRIVFCTKLINEWKGIVLHLPSRGQCWSVNCPSFSSPFENSWDKGREERRRRRRRGGFRDVSESTVQTTDTEKTNSSS